MSRLIANYCRLAVTLLIGLYITRTLLSADVALFSVYMIVTMGLAIGVMAREALRIATVSLIADMFVVEPSSNAVGRQVSGNSLRLIRKLAITTAAGSVLLSLPLVTLSGVIEMPPVLADQFRAFLMLRALGTGFLICAVPYLNVIAYTRRFGVYNLILLCERSIDLLSVMAIARVFLSADTENALLVGGVIHATLSLVLCISVWLYFGRVVRVDRLEFRKSGEERSVLGALAAISGPGLLVLNMAAYFRLSLPLSNILFGEAVGAMMAIAVQVSGYLRQAIQGLVLGLDSLFSRESRELTSQETVLRLDKRALQTGLLLIVSFGLLVPAIPYLLNYLTGETTLADGRLHQLTILLLAGVLLRALSEVWMQYLNGRGQTMTYAKILLVVAMGYVLTLLLIGSFQPSSPELLIGAAFVVSTGLSHMVVVPTCLARTLSGTSAMLRVLPVALALCPLVPAIVVHYFVTEPLLAHVIAFSVMATASLGVYALSIRKLL